MIVTNESMPQTLLGRVVAAALPRTAKELAVTTVLGLLWLPVFSAGYRAVLGLATADSMGGGIGASVLTSVHTFVTATSEAGLPAIACLSIGGLPLAFGWEAAMRAGALRLGMAVLLLLTPFVALNCWMVPFAFYPWWDAIAKCVGVGVLVSAPLWGVVWWANNGRLQAPLWRSVPALCVGISAVLFGLTVYVLVGHGSL